MPSSAHHSTLHSFPTRRSSDLPWVDNARGRRNAGCVGRTRFCRRTSCSRVPPRPRRRSLRLLRPMAAARTAGCSAPTLLQPRRNRSEEHTSELQSLRHLVCRLLPTTRLYTLSLHDALPISPGWTTHVVAVMLGVWGGLDFVGGHHVHAYLLDRGEEA